MKFNPEEINICSDLFIKGKHTSEVQDYLISKYNIKRCGTSNFVKMIRKRLGIYNKNAKLTQ